jgi:excisionase family DNA binding protein
MSATGPSLAAALVAELTALPDEVLAPLAVRLEPLLRAGAQAAAPGRSESAARHVAVRDAARSLGVSERTIRRAIDDGRLRAIWLGRAVRVDVSTLAHLAKPATARGSTLVQGPSRSRALSGEFSQLARGRRVASDGDGGGRAA